MELSPFHRHVSGPHPLASTRIGVGLVHVAGDEQGHPQCHPVVDERRTGAQIIGEDSGEIHDHSRAEEHDQGARLHVGVQLLTRVELADLEGAGAALLLAEPTPVIGGEPVQPSEIRPERGETQRDQDRDRKHETGDDVESLEQFPVAYQGTEIGEVQTGRTHDECDHQHRDRSVGPPFGARESGEARLR